MTDDERKILNDFADRFAATPSPPKDSEAEQFIRTRIGSRPDALYLMTQTVLMQNLALQQAQQQIQQLRSQGVQTPAGSSGSSGFLGQGQQRPAQSQYASTAPPVAPQYAAPAPSPPSPSVGSSGSGSFLRGAAQTAAGVAAGALAFEGIEHLFSHPFGGGYGGGFFGGGGVGGYAPPVEETVVNNYYDNGPQADAAGNYGQDDYQAMDDAASNAPDDNQQYDDGGNIDDAGGFDDGGGFDSGGDNFV